MRLKERLLHGIKVLVTGTPLMNAERFTIDFLTPMEHFFHFRVDFAVGNKKVCLSTFLRIPRTMRVIWICSEIIDSLIILSILS